jgi:cysteine synthase B
MKNNLVYDSNWSLLGRIGNTPLIAIRKLMAEVPDTRIYAKAEWFNPGGSVKDRAALRIVEDAEKDGRLTGEKMLLDASSGNTAIAYAMVCAVKGYRCKLVIPANVAKEKRDLLNAYGAEIVLSDPLEGTDGAQKVAKKMAQQDPELYYYADQYNNDSNWRAHYDGTAREIVAQTRGHFDYFLAGLGTGGTFTGISRYLKQEFPEVKRVAVQPDGPLHGLEGLKRMDASIRPGIFDDTLADISVEVSTEESQKLVRRLAREEGILVGPSSGAAIAACIKVSKEYGHGSFVTVFPDGGQKYLAEKFWEVTE